MYGTPHFVRILTMSIVFLMCLSSVGRSQIIDTRSSYSRQLDAVNLGLTTSLNYQFRGLDLNLTNRNGSRYFLINESPRNVQKEHDAALSLGYSLSETIALTSTARTFTFTNTGLRQDLALLGIRYRVHGLGTIEPMVGFMRDKRSNILDQGFSWAIRSHLNTFRFGDTLFEPVARAEVSYINPRRFVTSRFGTRAIYRFEDLLDMRSEIWHGSNRRDSYQATSLLNRAESNFMEAIYADTTFASLRLDFPLLEVLRTRIDIAALNNVRRILNSPIDENRDVILFDSRSLRQHLDLAAIVTYPSEQYRVSAGMGWSVQVRDSRLINTDGLPPDQVRRRTDILENSNFTQTRFELFTNNVLRWLPSYTTSFDMASSILRYDTPDINKDNRDEFAFLFRLGNEIRLNDQFSTSVLLAGEAFHYVYLYSERSIENNWRRSLRLIPRVTWNPSDRVTFSQGFMVRANYTVEDFELPGRQKSDQSAREMAFLSDFSYQFTPEWSLDIEASRSELRIGRLYWSTFEETPIDTLITYDIKATISKSYGQVIVTSGIRYFRKFDFLQHGSVQIETTRNGAITRITRIGTGNQTTTQWGPVVTVQLPFFSGNELFINGWYQHQKSWRRLYIDYPEEFREEFRRAERQTSRRVFPNLEMTARFRF